MNRIIASIAALLLSSTAFGWAVPVDQSTVSAGPHVAGEDIPCTFTNDDGQSFSGTVQVVDHHVLCVGSMVLDDDIDSIDAAYELTTPDGYELPSDGLDCYTVEAILAVCYDAAYDEEPEALDARSER